MLHRIPLRCTLILTNDCNFSCGYCFAKNYRIQNNENMSAGDWVTFIDDFKRLGGLFLDITGGEPLMSKNFFNVYEHAHRNNLAITLNTNLSLLNNDHLELFKRQPPRSIIVTLYGLSEFSCTNFCAAYSRRVIENINSLVDAGLNVTVRIVLNLYNYREFPKMKEAVERIGCKLVVFWFLIPEAMHGHSQKKYQVSPENLSEYFAVYTDFEDFLNVRANLDISAAGCPGGLTSFAIAPDGSIMLCQMDSYRELNIHNLPLSALWENLEARRGVLSEHNSCISCEHNIFCGQCPLVARNIDYMECGPFAEKTINLINRWRRHETESDLSSDRGQLRVKSGWK